MQAHKRTTIIIIAAAILLAGTLIFWRFVLPKNEQTKAPSTAQPQPNNPAPSVATNYVSITEWGVRFKRADNLTDVIYTLNTQNLVQQDHLTFSTKELASYGEDCAGRVSGITPLGMLKRSQDPQQEFTAANGSFVKQIGGYYYQYVTPQAACGTSPNESLDNLQQQTLTAFKSSIVTLEAIP